MFGFALDDEGDIVIENNEISLVVGEKLTQQKVKTVLHTNIGEWFFDREQGIDSSNLVGKNTNAELVRYEIERGLAQVDETFSISEFFYDEDRINRVSRISFKARTDNGESTGGEYSWA